MIGLNLAREYTTIVAQLITWCVLFGYSLLNSYGACSQKHTHCLVHSTMFMEQLTRMPGLVSIQGQKTHSLQGGWLKSIECVQDIVLCDEDTKVNVT